MSNVVKTSKFLSLILRHQPERIGLKLDANGWADIATLIDLANADGIKLTRALVQEIVDASDKKRFVISDDGMRIRANQGHSIEVDLNLPPSTPPEVLYHGTATRFESGIREKGLIAGKRQHVHLSPDVQTATKVGMRHGKPLILTIDASTMAGDGFVFYISDNGVWLTDHVPVKYITFPMD